MKLFRIEESDPLVAFRSYLQFRCDHNLFHILWTADQYRDINLRQAMQIRAGLINFPSDSELCELFKTHHLSLRSDKWTSGTNTFSVTHRLAFKTAGDPYISFKRTAIGSTILVIESWCDNHTEDFGLGYKCTDVRCRNTDLQRVNQLLKG